MRVKPNPRVQKLNLQKKKPHLLIYVSKKLRFFKKIHFFFFSKLTFLKTPFSKFFSIKFFFFSIKMHIFFFQLFFHSKKPHFLIFFMHFFFKFMHFNREIFTTLNFSDFKNHFLKFILPR